METLTRFHLEELHSNFLVYLLNPKAKTYVDTNVNHECEQEFTHLQKHFIHNIDLSDGFCLKHLALNQSKKNYLFELEGVDWFKSEWNISEELVKLQSKH